MDRIRALGAKPPKMSGPFMTSGRFASRSFHLKSNGADDHVKDEAESMLKMLACYML